MSARSPIVVLVVLAAASGPIAARAQSGARASVVYAVDDERPPRLEEPEVRWRTHAEPAHLVGLGLGISGVIGGGILALGSWAAGWGSIAAVGDPTTSFFAGLGIAGTGVLATIVASIALAVDRRSHAPRLALVPSLDGGASLTLSGTF